MLTASTTAPAVAVSVALLAEIAATKVRHVGLALLRPSERLELLPVRTGRLLTNHPVNVVVQRAAAVDWEAEIQRDRVARFPAGPSPLVALAHVGRAGSPDFTLSAITQPPGWTGIAHLDLRRICRRD